MNLQPSDFSDYKGEYDKMVYDIKLKNGTIIKSCWPNAGNFIGLGDSKNYKGSEVAQFKISNSELNDM